MMDNPPLSDVVASLLHKLEPSNLSKCKFPPDLENDLTKLKDALPLLLDPSRTPDLSLSTDDDLEYSVRRVDNLLDLHFDESSLIFEDDVEEEKRFEELRLVISRLAPLFKSCSDPSEITEFELPENVERLPPHLFRLVVYCSIYPKGHRFVRETLVYMWMALYLSPADIGKRHFEELLSRGIFEKPVSVFGNGNSRSVYSCEMSPVVHDAARRLAAEEVAVFNTRTTDGSSSAVVRQRTKHVAFRKNGFSRVNLEKVIQNFKNTTSLLMFSSHWDAFFGGSAGQIVRLDNIRRLCVLDLSGCQFKKLPPIHLSSLSGNVLLESFSFEFFPLVETLDIHGCVRLENVEGLRLPRNLSNLYLTSRQSSLPSRSPQIMLLELSHCVHLIEIEYHVVVRKLRIFDCPSLKTLHINYFEELVLHNCASLVLDFGKEHIAGPEPTVRFIKRNREEYFSFLKRLELVGLPMVRLPDWVQFAKVLEYFMIADCPQLQQLESLKYLRSLQELYIYNCPNLRSIPYNALYSLPNLSLLDVRNCPNFNGRPTWFSNIQGQEHS
ncbi:putative disease resistance RPP13-like protein 1 [Chenopodium quinoa]|uniref:putative disease resistance RPP13-like protein 1 n=1 Tax=Chenopodium quinoa TaxID=63459 RepID=UPI000B78D6EA|nr:putative disease resistance RPP13-like protein 1 [Chenopodium quinoa]